MNKTGRPMIELTDEQVIEVGALATVLNQDQIADYLNICRTTFYKIMLRDERVSKQYKRGKSKAIHEMANNLITQSKEGSVAASIFYLKTQAGWREEPTEVMNIPPINITLTNEAD